MILILLIFFHFCTQKYIKIYKKIYKLQNRRNCKAMGKTILETVKKKVE